MFIAWQQAFGVSFAELGLAMAVMSAAAALLQTPMGFLVDRYGARPFLIVGTKSDRLSGNQLRNSLHVLAREYPRARVVPFSAKSAAGHEELWKEIRAAVEIHRA